MATTHLQIPDIQANQNQKEVTANAAHDLLDKALNADAQKTITVSTSFTTAETRENFVIELIGTPGGAFTVNMPDANKRTIAVVNNSDSQATIRNSASGGTGQPVIAVGEASIFHYDGTNFFDLSALALAVASWLGLTDTPGSYAGQSGQIPTVNSAETALAFIKTAIKLPVRAATTAAGVLATDFENLDVIDGVTLATGDRILIKNQGTGSENGIYIVQATGAPVRADDFDDNVDVEGGVAVAVQEGSSNADTFWMLTNNGTITLGTTALTFAQLLSPGTFLSLSDTPSAYTNLGGMALRVNSAENAVEAVGTDFKIPVVAATTAAGTLATDFENGDTLDGVTLATGDRILIKDQATGSENGIYTVNATGAPTRALDFDDDADAVLGCVIAVNEGTLNAQTLWQLSNTTAVTIGSTTLTFASVGGSATNRWTEATVQTTDATVTNIATIALASGEATVVRGFIIGTQGSSTNTFAGTFVAAGKNNGGTSAQIAAPIYQKLDGDGGGSWDFTVDVDDTTDTIRIRVTGALATTINWTVQYESITET